MEKVHISHLTTEHRNSKTMALDNMSIHEFLTVMNEEDASVALSVKKELAYIEEAVKHIIEALKKGGRLIYVGSGTSGRLGVLDAVECPPTFSTTYEVVGIIAGGDSAFVKAKEGMEDSYEQGMQDIIDHHVCENDVVVGIAASGRTPHTIGALNKANELGAYTIALACNKNSEMGKVAKLKIEVETGPEVITGSTRLKAGIAQKLVLNMLSTASMIGMGKTYSNLVVEGKATNNKLIERNRRIIMEATSCTYEQASDVFERSGRITKLAIVMQLLDCDKEHASLLLEQNNGFIVNVL